MTNRERRLTDENTIFEEPRTSSRRPSNPQARVAEDTGRKDAARHEESPSRGQDEPAGVIDVDTDGIAHRRVAEDTHPTPPPSKGPTIGGGYKSKA